MTSIRNSNIYGYDSGLNVIFIEVWRGLNEGCSIPWVKVMNIAY